MANYYYPLPIPVSSDNRTNREKYQIKCIEEDPVLEAIYIGQGEFTEEQIQTIQTCMDQKEESFNASIPWIVGGIAVLFILLFAFSWDW